MVATWLHQKPPIAWFDCGSNTELPVLLYRKIRFKVRKISDFQRYNEIKDRTRSGGTLRRSHTFRYTSEVTRKHNSNLCPDLHNAEERTDVKGEVNS